MLRCARFYILLCFLLSSFIFTSAMKNSILSPRPSSNKDERIRKIESNLREVEAEMSDVRKALESGDTSNIKERLATLEGIFQTLRQQLAEERRRTSATLDEYDEELTKLTNYYNSLDAQLKALQAKVQEMARKLLPSETVEAIKGRRFAAAESLLIRLDDNTKISRIVHDVYDHSQENIDILLDFSRALTSSTFNYYLLSALRLEMKAIDHNDPCKTMELAKSLASKGSGSTASDVTAKSQVMLSETIAEIIDITTQKLLAAMKSGGYEQNHQVKKFATTMVGLPLQASDDIMRRLASEAYPHVSAVQVVENIASHDYIDQKAVALTALFWELKRANDLDNYAVLRIAEYLKQFKENHRDYSKLGEEKRTSVSSVIEALPACAKNLIFSSKVCLQNRQLSNDTLCLYMPRSSMVYDVEKNGQEFQFKTPSGLYLAPAPNNEHLLLFADIPVEYRAWTVELGGGGDFCHLKNKAYGKHLLASTADGICLMRLIRRRSSEDKRLHWKVTNCTSG